ncbi:hypothetical protein BASA50_010387 [Batrachochytrium salamandrivorans]|uniref:Protein kinase domain-containing protein n=1 Tax=Batrachochytrium salamandrivorans TaxID=1357716 RepID=A0ABQ8EYP4_9FUNG|nr:hypothetical protein BASA50_010387 [Batrachochytrium salamandrivorans]
MSGSTAISNNGNSHTIGRIKAANSSANLPRMIEETTVDISQSVNTQPLPMSNIGGNKTGIQGVGFAEESSQCSQARHCKGINLSTGGTSCETCTTSGYKCRFNASNNVAVSSSDSANHTTCENNINNSSCRGGAASSNTHTAGWVASTVDSVNSNSTQPSRSWILPNPLRVGEDASNARGNSSVSHMGATQTQQTLYTATLQQQSSATGALSGSTAADATIMPVANSAITTDRTDLTSIPTITSIDTMTATTVRYTTHDAPIKGHTLALQPLAAHPLAQSQPRLSMFRPMPQPLQKLSAIKPPLAHSASHSSFPKSNSNKYPDTQYRNTHSQEQQPYPQPQISVPVPPMSMAEKQLASHTLLPEFTNRFQLTSELGSGGFGFVLAAIDRVTQREVATKFILKSRVAANGWVRDPLLGVIPMEVYFLRHCCHANIISFVAMYSDHKFIYLVTELHGSQWSATKDHVQAHSVLAQPRDALMSHTPAPIVPAAAEPTSLAQYEAYSTSSLIPPSSLQRSNTCPFPAKLARRQSMDLFECIEQYDRIPEEKAKIIFYQVVQAIQYLHRKGVVHRDIKDENIVIDGDFHVKIIDFGSAAVEPNDPQFLFDRFQGTIQYASPEILRGEKYRGRPTDIWALGILLYTILFGEVPFASSEQAKTLNFKLPRFPSSAECMDLLSWILQKHASRRPTADQILRHKWFSSMHAHSEESRN